MSEPTETIEDAEHAYETGDLDRALEICELIIERDPDDVDALYLMGEAMLEMEEFEAAEEIFRDALRLDPESGGIHNGLGVALFELCRFDEAREALTTALELNPQLAESAIYLAYFHERRGERERAARFYRRAQEIDPEHFHAPIEVTAEVLSDVVEHVLPRLPDAVRAYVRAVPWTIEPLPTTAMLTATRPALSPLTLCLFTGPERDPTETVEPLDHLPREILVFASNFAKTVDRADDLPGVVLRAIVEELSHFLALDAAETEALGLERVLRQLDEAAAAAPEDGARTLH